MELIADQHIGIGAGTVGAPRDFARARVERGDPAAHPHFAAAVANQDFVFNDQRRHCHRLALADVAELGAPDLPSGVGVDRDRLVVERVEEHLAAGVNRAAINGVAACHPLRGGSGLGLEFPFERTARLGEVDRVKDIGVGRDDKHRVVGDNRCSFLAAQHADREGPSNLQIFGVIDFYLIEPAETVSGVILPRHDPLPVLLGVRCLRR